MNILIIKALNYYVTTFKSTINFVTA